MIIKSEPIDCNRATIAIDNKPVGIVSVENESTIRAIHFGGPRRKAPWLKHERRSFDNLSAALDWIIERQKEL